MSYTEENEVELQDLYDDEITDVDYGFVLDSEGNLKTVFVPSVMTEVPERVLKIFELFGIDNPHMVYQHTIH